MCQRCEILTQTQVHEAAAMDDHAQLQCIYCIFHSLGHWATAKLPNILFANVTKPEKLGSEEGILNMAPLVMIIAFLCTGNTTECRIRSLMVVDMNPPCRSLKSKRMGRPTFSLLHQAIGGKLYVIGRKFINFEIQATDARFQSTED